MSIRRCTCTALFLAACARGASPVEDVPADARVTVDAPKAAIDASDVDAAPGAPDAQVAGTPDAKIAFDAMMPPDSTPLVLHGLLLSEIVLAPTGSEFIEIVNPTASAVAIGDYYLSDNGTYWQLPANAQTLDTTDFIVKFPAGAQIPAHGVITVAIDTAASFQTAYGAAPTYSIADGTMTSVAGSATPSLTNAGEPVILFAWDGQSDLVTDVDMMIAGTPTTANALGSKSGAAQDGPDVGATTSTYATDANTLAPQTAPGSGKSTKRLLLDTGHQTAAGTGNGVDGVDCTSEDTAVTWDGTAYTAPTPGAVPAALLP